VVAHSHPPSSSRLWWTLGLNVIITVAEFVGGWITGFLALTADAVHNLSDVAAIGLAIFALSASRLPATKRSTYGFHRVEVLSALVSSAALLVIAGFILAEAWRRWQHPEVISNPTILFVIAAIGLLVNLFSMILMHHGHQHSLNTRSLFLHLLSDFLSSVIVLIGAACVLWFNISWIDPILSGFIGLMVVGAAWQIVREAVLILLNTVPKHLSFDDIERALAAIPDVQSVHDLHIWSLSSSETSLSVHLVSTDQDSERLLKTVRHTLTETFGIRHSTIQIETTPCADALQCAPCK
jgi:cobalt-zinc-cadmium efflux system protein